LSDALDKFLGEIDRNKLRVKRPTKFVFLCGGVILPDNGSHAANLRDYLWRVKGLGAGPTAYILAESAQQLYRDSGYSDLISFEEDIARIAAVVLVISESAGSLAELGAFCSNAIISPVLRVIISEQNYGQESFIRWGPVERVNIAGRDRVGVFHWTSDPNPDSLQVSADPLYNDIQNFIDGHVNSAASTMSYPADREVAVFYDIMWCTYLADAITPAKLFEAVKRVHSDVSQADFRRKLYTLRVAGWIKMVPFGGQDYYFLPDQHDPFQYGFKTGVVDKEPVRRVLSVRSAVFDGVPHGALRRVRDTRSGIA
jgi:hypothetical protein